MNIGTDLSLSHLSIYAIDNLYKNGWLDLNALWSNERDRSRYSCIIMAVEIVEGQWTVLWVNLGHPIPTDGIFSVRGGDAAHHKLLWPFLFADSQSISASYHCILRYFYVCVHVQIILYLHFLSTVLYGCSLTTCIKVIFDFDLIWRRRTQRKMENQRKI